MKASLSPEAGLLEYSRGGTLAGDKLTYLMNAGTAEKPARIRYTEDHASPNFLTYKAEAALGSGPRKVVAEGKITKLKQN